MRAQWYVAATSRQLGRFPLARRILGEDIVLFRDATGGPVALADRCPHRGARLSQGRVRDGCLSCPYHGWRFEGTGACAYIPSFFPGEPIPEAASIDAYQALERDGYVWVYLGDGRATGRLPREIVQANEPGWASLRLEVDLCVSVEAAIENAIDLAHRRYIHGRLFRGLAAREVRACVQTTSDGVVVDIREPGGKPGAFFGRLLRRGRHRVHFSLPSSVQVTHDLGMKGVVIIERHATPIDARTTRLHVRIAWRLGWATPLLGPFVRLCGRSLLLQDRRVLEELDEPTRRGGERRLSIAPDTAGQWVRECRERAATGEGPGPARAALVIYRQ